MKEPHILNPRTRGWLNRTMAKIGTQIGAPPTLEGESAEHFRAIARAAVGLDDLARAILAHNEQAVRDILKRHGYNRLDGE